MGTKRTVKHILEIALSNVVSIIPGVLIGLLLPKIISVDDYGMYKTFTLYLTYVGFFSLGIIDGIVLAYGGHDLESLNKKLFRAYWKWYEVIQVIFCITLLFISFIFFDEEYKFIFCMISINMVANNFTGYYQQLSLITQRFNEYSIRKIIQSISNILIFLVLFIASQNGTIVTYRSYVLFSVVMNAALAIWYVFTYRKLVFGERLSLKETSPHLVHMMKIGFPLLFANLCSTLILTLDRQFVNLLFDNKTYAVYAFAYNLLSLVTVATSAISAVIYPTLKRSNEEKLKEYYPLLNEIILLFVFFTVAGYFPLTAFIEFYLPKYSESLTIFRIIFPGLAISTSITVIMHNYYKTIGRNFIYFKKSIIVLVASAVANALSYMMFKSTAAISIASIITMLFWYIFVEQYFVKLYEVNNKRNLLYLLFMMVNFYSVTAVESWIIGLCIYIVCYLIVSMLFFGKTKNQIISIYKK